MHGNTVPVSDSRCTVRHLGDECEAIDVHVRGWWRKCDVEECAACSQRFPRYNNVIHVILLILEDKTQRFSSFRHEVRRMAALVWTCFLTAGLSLTSSSTEDSRRVACISRSWIHFCIICERWSRRITKSTSWWARRYASAVQDCCKGCCECCCDWWCDCWYCLCCSALNVFLLLLLLSGDSVGLC